jgi:DNA sulfur modification protein DndB
MYMADDVFSLGPFVHADPAARYAEVRKRRAKATFKTASLKTYEGFVAEGWDLAQLNKTSARLAKSKAIDEQLEDELFCLFADMGFSDLSLGRQFKIQVGKNSPPKQFDVFAADEEFAIAVECKSQIKAGPKRMQEIIGEFASYRDGVIEALRMRYGRGTSRKLAMVLATRGIEWNTNDLDRAEAARVLVLQDADLDYYRQLASHLGAAARFQLAAQLFTDQEVNNLSREVVANRGTMGGKPFYSFLIDPAHLLKISYVSHKRPGDAGAMDTYQRLISKKRLQEVAAFIDGGGKFPTNIVVNIRSPKGFKYEQRETIGDSSVGVLHLPKKYGACWVIDGQHRLYAYSLAADPKKALVSVLAFVGLSPQDQATMFVDINDKQKRVPKTLLVDIFSDLYASSTDPDERLLASSSKIIKQLNVGVSSPIRNRIVIGGDKKDRFRCLALASLNEELLKTDLIGAVRDGLFRPGPLSVSDKFEPTLKKAYDVLTGFFSIFASAAPEQWEAGDGEGGYLCTNNALRALMRVLRELCAHADKANGLRCEDLSAAEVLERVVPYVEPLAAHFAGASTELLRGYRMLQGSAGQRNQSMKMMVVIREAKPDFNPPGLDDYLQDQDVAANGKASAIITDLQRSLFDLVLGKLKAEFGDAWWKDGVPVRIRTDCVQRREEDPEYLDPEQYLYLKDYITIAANNWALFGPYFSLMEKGGKDAQLDWMQKVNKIRNKTMHPERGLVTQSELQFLRDHQSRFATKVGHAATEAA